MPLAPSRNDVETCNKTHAFLASRPTYSLFLYARQTGSEIIQLVWNPLQNLNGLATGHAYTVILTRSNATALDSSRAKLKDDTYIFRFDAEMAPLEVFPSFQKWS